MRSMPKPSGKMFTYIVVPTELCYAKFGPQEEGSFLSEDPNTKLLDIALKEGYRWLRSEDDFAIFEKEWTTPP